MFSEAILFIQVTFNNCNKTKNAFTNETEGLHLIPMILH